MTVTARDGAGQTLRTLTLNPRTVAEDGLLSRWFAGGGVDFTPGPGTTLIDSSSELARLSDPAGAFLQSKGQPHALVDHPDRGWPLGAGYSSAGRGRAGGQDGAAGLQRRLQLDGLLQWPPGDALPWSRACSSNSWPMASGSGTGELENNGIRYATDAWSAVLPADWIRPGLALQLSQGTQSGELVDLQVGAPSELLIHTIDIGMLTTPRDQFAFARDPEAHREYFQTVPTSRLIVSQYAPVAAGGDAPNGTLLTDFDPEPGGWHRHHAPAHRQGADLPRDRQRELRHQQHGRRGGSSHPYVVASWRPQQPGQVRQRHPGARRLGRGGSSPSTAPSATKFSHEVGHNYGLGHYVGGFTGIGAP